MTTAVAYLPADNLGSPSSTLGETRTASSERTPGTVVLLSTSKAPWLKNARRRLHTSARLSPAIDASTLDRALDFIEDLPWWIREPFVAVGDAGIVDLEWESVIGDLTLSFSASGDSVSWLGADGEEWELPARRASALSRKLLDISRA